MNNCTLLEIKQVLLLAFTLPAKRPGSDCKLIIIKCTLVAGAHYSFIVHIVLFEQGSYGAFMQNINQLQ